MKKIILLLVIVNLISCKPTFSQLETVESVDLAKYTGLWYEIALLPFKFEEGCSCTTAEYVATNKNYIKVINTCFKNKKTIATGKAFIVKGSNNTKLKVQFFWPFKGDYWIIGLADDYSWALVGAPDYKYLWILSRTQVLNEQTYNTIVELAKSKGFDTTRLIKTNQFCK